jgi:hypothetical protein
MRGRVALATAVVLAAIMVFAAWNASFNQRQEASGFGIYLSANNQLIVSDKDIISYNVTSHQIKFSSEGVNRFVGMDLHHKSFTAKLNGGVLYNGSFWSDMDSMSYQGVAIVDIVLIEHNATDTLRVEQCYPPGYCSGVDPRINQALFDYFESIGKLVH